ncbi:MAG: antitoxin VapB family protein [Candidatus Thermoplasmatota archaeon]
MGSKTISLEDSAYAKLRAAKRPGESFSDVIQRVLGDRQPSFLDFRGLLDRKSAERLAKILARMREEDLEAQKGRTPMRG